MTNIIVENFYFSITCLIETFLIEKRRLDLIFFHNSFLKKINILTHINKYNNVNEYSFS